MNVVILWLFFLLDIDVCHPTTCSENNICQQTNGSYQCLSGMKGFDFSNFMHRFPLKISSLDVFVLEMSLNNINQLLPSSC